MAGWLEESALSSAQVRSAGGEDLVQARREGKRVLEGAPK
jgi:hypothetical protein